MNDAVGDASRQYVRSVSAIPNRVEDRLCRLAARPARIYAILFCAYFLAAFFIFRRLIFTYFTADEVDILGNVDGRSFIEIFTRYDVSANNFVPLLLASLKLDWTLFEWWLPGYRLHGILAAVTASLLFVALLRHACDWTVSILGGYAFLMSVDVAALVGYTASRHYLEGLIPALAAVLLVLRYRRKPSHLTLFAAVACYFASCLFKEVFVPLPAALALVPGLCRKRRMTLLFAFTAAFVAYFIYRKAMLSGFVGGYGGGKYRAAEIAAYFLRAWPWFSAWMLFGTRHVDWWLMIPANLLLIVALVGAVRTSRWHALAFLTLLACALGPVALVLGTPEVNFIQEANHYCQRFTFPAFVVILAAAAMALARFDRRIAAAALLCLILIGGARGREQVRSWAHDGAVTRKSAVAFERWWDKHVIYAADIPRQLHLGLQKIWARRSEIPPDRLARVIPALPGAIYPNHPALSEPGIQFVEELRSGESILSRDEFIRRYATAPPAK